LGSFVFRPLTFIFIEYSKSETKQHLPNVARMTLQILKGLRFYDAEITELNG
jgi:hypothetical protein